MYAHPGLQPAGGTATMSLHQSLDHYHHSQAAHAATGGRATLPNILHDALYAARSHALGDNLIRSTACEKNMQKDCSGASGNTLPDMLASQSCAGQGSPWQADLMADLISNHGSNLRLKPIVHSSSGAAAPSRPSAAYGTIVQERGGLPGQYHTAAAFMQQQAKLAAVASALGSSGSSSHNTSTSAERPGSIPQNVTNARDIVRQQVAATASKHPGVFGSLSSHTTVMPAPACSALYQRLQPALSAAGQSTSRQAPGSQQLQQQRQDRTGVESMQQHRNGSYPSGGSDQRAVSVLMQLSPAPQRWQQQHSTKPSQQAGALRVGSVSAGKHHGGTPGAACSSNDSTTAYLDCTEELAAPEEMESPGPSYPASPVSLVHTQCYVYRPISYPDHVSPDALTTANAIMFRLTIPGGIKYKPVQYNSKLYQQGCRFGFTAFALCLGSSYFQRLLAGMPHLEYAVRRSGPSYTDYLDCMAPCSERRWAALHAQYGSQYGSSTQVTEESTLASIQFACVYLATKIVDRMPMLEMLRYILTHLYGSVVSKAQAYDVESKCLEGLGFRLGPYFRDDKLDDDWPY